ncbi:MAG: PQQ-dependent sugar dehydrogenase [Pseudomonadota bacterium]
MRQIGTVLTASASALVLMAAGTTAHADGHGERMNVPKIETTEFMTELENPWDMSFLPDGTMFFTEKCAGLSVRDTAGNVNKLYGVKDSTGYPDSGDDLFCDGQAGVLGVAVDWDFAENRTLYLYSSSTKYYGDGCKSNFEKCDGNIVMRFTVSEDLASVSDRTDIVTDIQYKPFESDQPLCAQRRSPSSVVS